MDWKFGDLVESNGDVAIVLGLAPADFTHTVRDDEADSEDEHSYQGGRHQVLLVLKSDYYKAGYSYGMYGEYLKKFEFELED